MMGSPSEDEVCPKCQRCERWRAAPDYLRDPMILWDRFPCPPPGTDHARLLIELDLTGRLGTKSGCEALQRVARRCNVDFRNLQSLPTSLPECVELFEAGVLCGTNCFIAFILAGICVLFCLLLVIVCVRYVRREKQSSALCTKVLTSGPTATNTHINKEYAQNQDGYGPNGIPHGRGLPYEARLTNSGVEARLLKAIQENQLQQYNSEKLCSQCLAESRQGSEHGKRNRLGYEIIYWKDGDFFVKQVPSQENIRMSLNRDHSVYGGSINGSHHYEYISDQHTDCSYNSTGKMSDHSARFYTRNNFQRVSSLDNYANNSIPWNSSRTSIHSRYDERGQNFHSKTDRVPYQPCSSDKVKYQESSCDRPLHKGYYSDTTPEAVSKYTGFDFAAEQTSQEASSFLEQASNESNMNKHNSSAIKGYKYIFNPTCVDDPLTLQGETETFNLQMWRSELSQMDSSTNDDNTEQVTSNCKVKHRQISTCSDSSNNSDSASGSGHSSRARAIDSTLPRRKFSNSDRKYFT